MIGGVDIGTNDSNTRKEQIAEIVQAYYERLDFLQYNPLPLMIDKYIEMFIDSKLTIDEIEQQIAEDAKARRKSLETKYQDKNAEVCNETIYGKLEQLIRAFQKSEIDYQLAGTVAAYLKYGVRPNYCHNGIEMNLNERDLEAFSQICSEIGFSVEDNRNDPKYVHRDDVPRGDAEIIVRESEDSFPIKIYLFEREDDGSVITKEYCKSEDGKLCVREETFSPSFAQEIFHGEEIAFRGISVCITPPEYVYLLKSYSHHPKDKQDNTFLENQVDPNKIAHFIILSDSQKVAKTVLANHIPKTITRKQKAKNMQVVDLSSEVEEVKEDVLSRKKEEAEMFRKKKMQVPANSEEGFISNTIITTLALITFVLCFIGIAVIYFVQM